MLDSTSVTLQRSWAAIWLGLAAAIALIAWTLWPSSTPREYLTATVTRGPLVASVAATGTVNPVNSVTVGTYVSGPIQEIYADFNTAVTAGQKIAKIDPRTFVGKVDSARAALADAQARVQRAEADLRLKRLQLQRSDALSRTRVLSVNELDVARAAADQAEADSKLAQAEVDKARAALREAEVNLGYTDIVSPIDGIVVSRNVDVGQTVAASFQTPTLFVVAKDLARMQVNAFVSEADIGRVHEGQEATFSVDAHPGRSFPAKVRQVRNSPTTLQNVVTYDVVLDVDNTDRSLKPGMTANVRIVTGGVDDALLVPQAALRFRPPVETEDSSSAATATANAVTRNGASARDGADQVYRLEDGRAVAIPVQVGLTDDTAAQVTSSALAPGDRVILRIKSAAPPPAPAWPGSGTGRRR
jgi:HlyD family secretion protein